MRIRREGARMEVGLFYPGAFLVAALVGMLLAGPVGK